jgi:hypothetical protein
VDYHRGADCGGDLLVQEVVFASRDEDARDRIPIPFNFGRAVVGCAENDVWADGARHLLLLHSSGLHLLRFNSAEPFLRIHGGDLPLENLVTTEDTEEDGGNFTKCGILGAVYKNRTKQKLQTFSHAAVVNLWVKKSILRRLSFLLLPERHARLRSRNFGLAWRQVKKKP